MGNRDIAVLVCPVPLAVELRPQVIQKTDPQGRCGPMLELKSLLLGLVLAMVSFAAKTGAGLFYLVSGGRPSWRTISLVSGVILGYWGMFLLSWFVCSRVDVVLYFNDLQGIFRSGMVLHSIVAAGMLVWGLSLLRRRSEQGESGSTGWLALVVPCPVCASVIFFTTGFLVNLFPDESFRVVLFAGALFTLLVLITSAVLRSAACIGRVHPDRTLGYSMFFTAAYFILTVLTVPHFGDLKRVYHLAEYHSTRAAVRPGHLLGVLLLSASCVTLGFLVQRIRRGRIQ